MGKSKRKQSLRDTARMNEHSGAAVAPPLMSTEEARSRFVQSRNVVGIDQEDNTTVAATDGSKRDTL